MNNTIKTAPSLFLGLIFLLAAFALPVSQAVASEPTGKEVLPNTISEQEILALADLYSLEDEIVVENVTVKIYNANDELIYSVIVCQNDFECDERINHIVNKSDFITEVDNTRIYYMD